MAQIERGRGHTAQRSRPDGLVSALQLHLRTPSGVRRRLNEGLAPSQTRALQKELSAALIRNDPVRTVVATILAAVKAAQTGTDATD